jgi:hypothetical protein
MYLFLCYKKNVSVRFFLSYLGENIDNFPPAEAAVVAQRGDHGEVHVPLLQRTILHQDRELTMAVLYSS